MKNGEAAGGKVLSMKRVKREKLTEEKSCSKTGVFLDDIERALAVIGQLEALPAQRFVTASEIAEGIYGVNHGLDQVIEIYRAAGILVHGRDGYGYQIAVHKEKGKQ